MGWGITIGPVRLPCRIRHACKQRNFGHLNARLANSQRSVREFSAPGSAGPEIFA